MTAPRRRGSGRVRPPAGKVLMKQRSRWNGPLLFSTTRSCSVTASIFFAAALRGSPMSGTLSTNTWNS
eukprot:11007528-Alexandrium_andersonii.AAC.1